MATFSYLAKDSEGRTRKGAVEAGSEVRAADVLREQGFTVISISAKRGTLDIGAWLGKLRGVSEKEKVAFTRQLATMIGAGLPLTQALSILREQSGEDPFGEILEYVLGEVQGGKPLSASLRKFPEVFPRTYTALIGAAEASGAMPEILSRLAENLEKSGKIKNKIKGALLYPAIVLVAMTGVGVLLLIFVLPQLKTMYESFEADLPFVTQIFISLSDFLINFWWLAILIVTGLVLGFRALRRTERGEHFLAELTFKVPVFGTLVRQLVLVEVTRTLSLLILSGVPILDALDITAESAGNVLFREALMQAGVEVERGESLAVPLEASGCFPPIVARMVRVGEESGEMGNVLLRMADYFAGEAEHAIANLTTALEPIIMLVLGVGVGFMVISIIMPIYNLTGQF